MHNGEFVICTHRRILRYDKIKEDKTDGAYRAHLETQELHMEFVGEREGERSV